MAVYPLLGTIDTFMMIIKKRNMFQSLPTAYLSNLIIWVPESCLQNVRTLGQLFELFVSTFFLSEHFLGEGFFGSINKVGNLFLNQHFSEYIFLFCLRLSFIMSQPIKVDYFG